MARRLCNLNQLAEYANLIIGNELYTACTRAFRLRCFLERYRASASAIPCSCDCLPRRARTWRVNATSIGELEALT